MFLFYFVEKKSFWRQQSNRIFDSTHLRCQRSKIKICFENLFSKLSRPLTNEISGQPRFSISSIIIIVSSDAQCFENPTGGLCLNRGIRGLQGYLYVYLYFRVEATNECALERALKGEQGSRWSSVLGSASMLYAWLSPRFEPTIKE